MFPAAIAARTKAVLACWAGIIAGITNAIMSLIGRDVPVGGPGPVVIKLPKQKPVEGVI